MKQDITIDKTRIMMGDIEKKKTKEMIMKNGNKQ